MISERAAAPIDETEGQSKGSGGATGDFRKISSDWRTNFTSYYGKVRSIPPCTSKRFAVPGQCGSVGTTGHLPCNMKRESSGFGLGRTRSTIASLARRSGIAFHVFYV
jgi:hypothetical protein